MNWASKGIAAAAGVVLAGAAAAGPVVVRSTGPSARAYPAGRQLPDAAQIALRPGDTVVLLDSRGTRTLSGPGTFPAVGGGTRTNAAQTAKRILTNQTASERRGGAVRGGTPGGEARSPNLWFVDMAKGGTVCVADVKAVRLWRASGAKPAEVRITGTVGGGAVTLPQGATVADWPEALPIVNGAEFTLAAEGAIPARIKFATVPLPTSLEATASQLIAKGCQAQLDLLIAQTSAG